jgi:hypothetical protein
MSVVNIHFQPHSSSPPELLVHVPIPVSSVDYLMWQRQTTIPTFSCTHKKDPLIKSSKHVILDVSLDHRATRKHLHLAFYEAILSMVYPTSRWCPLPLETTGRQATDTRSSVPQGRPRAPQHRRSYLNMFVILAASKTFISQTFFSNIYGALCISRHLFLSPIGLGNLLACTKHFLSGPSGGSHFFI